MLNKFKTLLSKRFVKSLFGLILVLGGIIWVSQGALTYFPVIAICVGIFIIWLSVIKIKSMFFYKIVFFYYFVLASMFNELFVKGYSLKITLPSNQDQFYFIASNQHLKWSDLLLTWLTPREIQADFEKGNLFVLKRGIPLNIVADRQALYNSGYTQTRAYGKGRYEYIVLIPLVNKTFNVDKGRIGDSYYSAIERINSDSNEKLIEKKVDSLEKYELQ